MGPLKEQYVFFLIAEPSKNISLSVWCGMCVCVCVFECHRTPWRVGSLLSPPGLRDGRLVQVCLAAIPSPWPCLLLAGLTWLSFLTLL